MSYLELWTPLTWILQYFKLFFIENIGLVKKYLWTLQTVEVKPSCASAQVWANSVDPDQMLHAAFCSIWSGSTLFATHRAISHTFTGSKIDLMKRNMRVRGCKYPKSIKFIPNFPWKWNFYLKGGVQMIHPHPLHLKLNPTNLIKVSSGAHALTVNLPLNLISNKTLRTRHISI